MKTLGLVLVVLVALVAAAWFNYERNAPLDKDLKFRPYAGLSDTDLASLVDAYNIDIVEKTRQLRITTANDHVSDSRKVIESHIPPKP